MQNHNFKKYFFLGATLFFTVLINSAIISVCYAEEATTTEQIPMIIETTTETTTTLEVVTSTPDITIPAPSTEIPVVIEPTTNIFLKIATNQETLYSNDLTVTACVPNDNTTSTTLTIYCGLKQLAEKNNWDIAFNDYGGLKFLSKINNYDGSDYNWWAFFHNLNFASEALNQYELKEGDKIILSYGTFPLKLEISSSTPTIGTTTTISVKEFGFDMNWNSAWLDSTNSALAVNDEQYPVASGTFELYISTTSPYSIYATKNGLISSDTTIINPITVETTTPPTKNPNTGGGGSGSNTNQITDQGTQIFSVEKAIQYLDSKQTNGDFQSTLYTDWAAIAYSAFDKKNPTTIAIKNYLQTNPDAAAGFNNVSDYARRAMALMALDINPYNGTNTDYIKKITDTFDGRQLGDTNLFNDDIFALIALAKAGYSANDEMTKKTIDFVLSKQTNDNWGSVDLTAAAIQALKNYPEISETNEAIQKAFTYLKNNQKTNGSFDNNVFSTAWSIQTGNTLSESDAAWLQNAQNYLVTQQDSTNGSVANDIWATAQTIPAALNKSWSQIMTTFNRPQISTGDNNSGSPASTETSTTPIVTSTLSTIILSTTTDAAIKAATTSALAEEPTITKPLLITKQLISKPITKKLVTTTSQSLAAGQAPTDEEIKDIINELPLDTSQKNTAKKILEISGGSTLILGLYLGLRLFKNMV